MARIRQHLSYSNVVATLALVLAIGGGIAWAALPKNSIGSKQIKKGGVRNSDVQKGSLTGNRLRKNTVTGGQVNEGTLGAVPTATVGNSPLAYAHVDSTGAVDAPNSRGLTNANVVKDPANGRYCITGVAGAKTAAVVADGPNAEDASVHLGAFLPAGTCSGTAGTQFTVSTTDYSGSFVYVPFFIWIYGP